MNNQVCMPGFYFTLLMIALISSIFWGLYQLINYQQQETKTSTNNSPPIIFNTPPPPTVKEEDDLDDLETGELPAQRRDYRRLYDVLKEPARRYVTYPGGTYPGGNINIPTQGYLPNYQNMGYLSRVGSDSSNGKNNNLLKLFGRRIDTYRYEYYTTHHKDPTLKIPLEIKGDRELMEGDTIKVPGYNQEYKVTLYEYDAPKYIPYY